MNGHIFPAEFFSKTSFLENIFYEPYTIQFFHRLGGIILFGIACYLIFLNLKTNNGHLLESYEVQFSLLILLQFFLGILTLLLKVPIYLAVSHQLCACFVLLLASKILYTINNK